VQPAEALEADAGFSCESVLGTLVDPLGIFANSDLVKLDETDKRALDASQRLVEILQKQTSVDTAALRNMQPQELQVRLAQLCSGLGAWAEGG
jgi:lipopolysaccharide biosynthesis regulator YciM